VLEKVSKIKENIDGRLEQTKTEKKMNRQSHQDVSRKLASSTVQEKSLQFQVKNVEGKVANLLGKREFLKSLAGNLDGRQNAVQQFQGAFKGLIGGIQQGVNMYKTVVTTMVNGGQNVNNG